MISNEIVNMFFSPEGTIINHPYQEQQFYSIEKRIRDEREECAKLCEEALATTLPAMLAMRIRAKENTNG